MDPLYYIKDEGRAKGTPKYLICKWCLMSDQTSVRASSATPTISLPQVGSLCSSSFLLGLLPRSSYKSWPRHQMIKLTNAHYSNKLESGMDGECVFNLTVLYICCMLNVWWSCLHRPPGDCRTPSADNTRNTYLASNYTIENELLFDSDVGWR